MNYANFLSTKAIRDRARDTSALREMFQYSSPSMVWKNQLILEGSRGVLAEITKVEMAQ